jgi:ribonuclease G
MVQASKEPIGTKGPRVTSHISLPGRFLVFMPGSNHIGVSRKIEVREERTRLRALAREVVPNGAGGVIIRTVGEELTREIFQREFNTLHETLSCRPLCWTARPSHCHPLGCLRSRLPWRA